MGIFILKEMSIRFVEIHEALDRATGLGDKAWFNSIDLQTKQLIIDLNTKNQLGEHGIDSTENSLGEYAPLSVEIRLGLGLQVGHIDFKITGEYWGSWEIEVTNNEITINIDENRFSELVNDLRFSEDHVGLTIKNMAIVKNLIREKYIAYVTRQLLR